MLTGSFFDGTNKIGADAEGPDFVLGAPIDIAVLVQQIVAPVAPPAGSTPDIRIDRPSSNGIVGRSRRDGAVSETVTISMFGGTTAGVPYFWDIWPLPASIPTLTSIAAVTGALASYTFTSGSSTFAAYGIAWSVDGIEYRRVYAIEDGTLNLIPTLFGETGDKSSTILNAGTAKVGSATDNSSVNERLGAGGSGWRGYEYKLNHALSQILTRATPRFKVDTGGSLMTSLVEYWKLQEGVGLRMGALQTLNMSEFSNGALLYGAVASNSQSILYSRSAVFVNQNAGQYLATPDNSYFATGSGAFSIAGWFYSTASGNQNMAAQYSGGVTKWFLNFGNVANTVAFYVYDNGGTQSNQKSQGSIALNAWHFAAAIYDGANIRVFVDGVTSTNLAIANPLGASTSVRLSLGGTDDATTSKFAGYLNGWGYWTKALSAQELNDLYNNGTGNKLIASPNF